MDCTGRACQSLGSTPCGMAAGFGIGPDKYFASFGSDDVVDDLDVEELLVDPSVLAPRCTAVGIPPLPPHAARTRARTRPHNTARMPWPERRSAARRRTATRSRVPRCWPCRSDLVTLSVTATNPVSKLMGATARLRTVDRRWRVARAGRTPHRVPRTGSSAGCPGSRHRTSERCIPRAACRAASPPATPRPDARRRRGPDSHRTPGVVPGTQATGLAVWTGTELAAGPSERPHEDRPPPRRQEERAGGTCCWAEVRQTASVPHRAERRAAPPARVNLLTRSGWHMIVPSRPVARSPGPRGLRRSPRRAGGREGQLRRLPSCG